MIKSKSKRPIRGLPFTSQVELGAYWSLALRVTLGSRELPKDLTWGWWLPTGQFLWPQMICKISNIGQWFPGVFQMRRELSLIVTWETEARLIKNEGRYTKNFPRAHSKVSGDFRLFDYKLEMPGEVSRKNADPEVRRLDPVSSMRS